MKNEQGFTLMEMMCALFVLSLALLVSSGLAQAAQTEERKAALRLAIDAEAVSVMENWRMQSTVAAGTNSSQIVLANVTVTETRTIQAVAGLNRLTLSYAWPEGGQNYAQTWATLHR